MTREEAIQYIDGLRCKEDFPYTDTIADFVKERNEAIDMAIEALEAEMDCTDFVNWLLEEVMDEEMWKLNAVGNGEIICRKLKKLGLLEVKDGYYIRPSDEAVKGWIPCSERLPQVNETVITCDADGDIHLDYIIKLGDSSLDFCQNVAYGDCDIIAWMPLPKSYKGGERSEE